MACFTDIKNFLYFREIKSFALDLRYLTLKVRYPSVPTSSKQLDMSLETKDKQYEKAASNSFQHPIPPHDPQRLYPRCSLGEVRVENQFPQFVQPKARNLHSKQQGKQWGRESDHKNRIETRTDADLQRVRKTNALACYIWWVRDCIQSCVFISRLSRIL